MNNLFSNLFSPFKQNKGFAIFLIIATIVVIALGIFSAIQFDDSVLIIDLENVTYIRYLKGDSGFGGFLFGTLISVLIFYIIILSCCSKKYLLPFAVVFYLYLVYSQFVIFTCVILIYGFFNTFIFLLLLLIYFLTLYFLFILLFLTLTNLCGQINFFRLCFNRNSNVLILTILFIILVILFSIILMFLKSYIILLIY